MLDTPEGPYLGKLSSNFLRRFYILLSVNLGSSLDLNANLEAPAVSPPSLAFIGIALATRL